MLQDIVLEGIELINGSGISGLTDLRKDQAPWHNHTTYVKVVEVTDLAASFFIAESKSSVEIDHYRILELVKKGFSNDELRDLSLRLHVDFDDLPGGSRADKAREFILYMQRRGRLSEFVAICAQERDYLPWPIKDERLLYKAKQNTAVMIDFTQLKPTDVARYLNERNIDANFVLFTHKVPYMPKKPLLPTISWETILRTFADTIQQFKGTKLHYFVSAPGALAFGLGSIQGTVDTEPVYHWQNDTYYHVLNTDRNLK